MMIKTKRLLLRPYEKSDQKSMIENINDKMVSRYMCMVSHPYTKKDAEKWEGHLAKLKNKKSKKEINFAIINKKDFIGGISLKSISYPKAEIGYWIGRKHWNKGFATEAINAVMNLGFKKFKLKKIYAYVFEKNTASANLLEKLGFEKEGFLKKDRVKDGKFVNVHLYAKIR